MEVEILLDKSPRGLFFIAGDKISGKVVCRCSSAKVVKRAMVSFFAKEDVKVFGQNLGIKCVKTLFYENIELIKSLETIPAGATSFDFCFTLPLQGEVAKLGPVRGTAKGDFKIEYSVQFVAEADSLPNGRLESAIPIPIAPLWGAYLPPRSKLYDPFRTNAEITRFCSCRDKQSAATIIIEGCPTLASWSGQIRLPLTIKI